MRCCSMLTFVDLKQEPCQCGEWKKATRSRMGSKSRRELPSPLPEWRGGSRRTPPRKMATRTCGFEADSLWSGGGGGGPTGEGRGERGDAKRRRTRSGRRRSRASPPVATSCRRLLSRWRRGSRSPPPEWWNPIPGRAAETTRKGYHTDIQTARWACPGQFDPWIVWPGKLRGTPRERLEPNKP
jgi:hypothetical protein